MPGHDPFRSRPETSPGPVAIHRAANFAADGKTKSKSVRVVPVFSLVVLLNLKRLTRHMGTGLKDQPRRHPLVSGPGNTQELAPLLQPQHVGRLDVDRHGQAG